MLHKLFEPALLSQTGCKYENLLLKLDSLSLRPPFPWGQVMYGRALESVLPNVEGDVAEFGVGRGGMALFLATIASNHNRQFLAFDTFGGLPDTGFAFENPYFKYGDYRSENDSLLSDFNDQLARRGLYEKAIVKVGEFRKTLEPSLESKRLSFVHIDADLFESTLEALRSAYPRLAKHGLLVLDDFFHPAQGVARAAERYFGEIGVDPTYYVAFPQAVVIVKDDDRKANTGRAVDGNRYCFDFLKRETELIRALEIVSEWAAHEGLDRDVSRLAKLQSILTSKYDKADDIYDYWSSLAGYWQRIDLGDPSDRSCLTI